MRDLINRQNAKDAVDMALDMMDHVPQWVVSNLLNALDKVPSAEPEKVLVAEVKLSKEQIQSTVDEAVEKIRAEMEEPEIIRCKDCKYYIPYEWMFDGLTRSSNKDDYAPDEIGCSVNDHNYPPCGFCSFAERREDE